ncbi:DUF4358 domain-containing protein [uncultured Flavonifractor sp.]|uniref:DUF4358 domain-containing protein n=1 Tax=uncultured Flavonifractor sp. TaxID=1193534 RepID=UPI00262E39C7|nr:DUF4358 domain-containing protein [uncultured Flavonifractor sp.]
MNHRFLALALAGTMTFGLLTACGGGNGDGISQTPDAVTTPPAVESTTPAPESTSPIVEESPDASPESSAPVEESAAPSSTPTAKPSASAKPTTQPTATPKPTAKPTPTPTPESKPQTNAVQSTWDDISKLSLPNLTAMDDATLSAMYGINASDLEEYVCMMPLMGVHSTEFFIAEVKDGKMDTVKAGIAKRQADLDAQWSQYLPDQYELVKNYKLVTNGNYVLFAISEYADKAVSIFDSYTK